MLLPIRYRLEKRELHVRFRTFKHEGELGQILEQNLIWMSDILKQDDRTEGRPLFSVAPPTRAALAGLLSRKFPDLPANQLDDC